jgi:signal transduction histidine kinase
LGFVLADLRSLARGIYPPLLADQGLRAALQAQVGRAPLPVEIQADGIGRYPRETEAAIYFCILEALQNVAKYARASRATVALSCPDGHLEFSVADDGAGFETGNAAHGTGLQGMADRLAAAGGTLDIHSEPGLGTTISGTLPAPSQDGGKSTTYESHQLTA